VWDLYCGTGSIALFMAPRVSRVVGFEVVEEAVQDAYQNCAFNGIDNCSFLAGDLKDLIRGGSEADRKGARPDVVVTDPPRSGMHPRVVEGLLGLAPPRIFYVSCNPATLARDLAQMAECYRIQAVQPFDLFPHTPHIECLVELVRKDGGCHRNAP
jgi:23S rRNA (uracil1939-C5)-methyltransferase